MYGRGAKAIAEQTGSTVQEAQSIVSDFYDSFPDVKKWMDGVLDDAYKKGYVETLCGRRRHLPDIMLKKYEFTLTDATAGDFDPLSFDGNVDLDVPYETKKYFADKLDRAWGYEQRQNVLNEARREGIQIKDNGGKIADAERQCVNSIIQGGSADLTKLAMINIARNDRLKELDCHLCIQVHDEVIASCPMENAKEAAGIMTKIMIETAESITCVPFKCDAEVSKSWYGEVIEV